MSAITPQTELRLIKCPIEKDNLNQINFASKEAQYNYFNSLTHITADKFTYQRKDGIIRFPNHIDNLLGYNYVMYQNEAFTDKWFYAFITNMEYVNNEMTNITIKTDVFQTWQFDLIYKQSFIEREHVNNDTAGLHTIPEGLETGPYIAGSKGIFDWSNPIFEDWAIVMSITPDDELFPAMGNRFYGGVFGGTFYIEFDGLYITQAAPFIRCMNAAGKLDAITSIFMYPTIALDTEGYQFTFGNTVISCGLVKSSQEAEEFAIPIGEKPTKLGSYTPRNKKLLTGDYTYLLTDNGVGGVKKYNFEDFASGNSPTIIFNFYANLTPSGSIMYAPKNYKGVSAENTLESFSGGKYPMCSWSGDPYTNWLTQSSINRSFNFGKDAAAIAVSTLATVGGAATGNPALLMLGASGLSESVSGTINDVINDVKERKQHQIAPPELVGNETLGDVIFAYQRCIPKYYYMHIKEEYAQIIDKYFDMYGYQVNIVKLPNITGRTNWNYVKTVNINLEGDIPEGDLQEIKNIFNNGVTIWHNPSNYLDYSVSNAIV